MLTQSRSLPMEIGAYVMVSGKTVTEALTGWVSKEEKKGLQKT